VLVFDDYRDTGHWVDKALPAAREAYFFVSHAHFDHLDRHILGYSSQKVHYFLSDDIRLTSLGSQFPPAATTFLPVYSSYADNDIKVRSYASTDIGTSFLVEKDGRRIFHAGDFNWWHWQGDTSENMKLAENGFRKQMKKLEGLEADVAFFPVDGRLEGYQADGAREFCARTAVQALVAMHRVGYPVWEPATDFFAKGRSIPVWAPTQPGEVYHL
jgi:L-ascorbate metabolism protein UlaG (beta-lactamase superfamily)